MQTMLDFGNRELPPNLSSQVISGEDVPDYLKPSKPTGLLNLYWWFAAERQRIFFHRAAGQRWPWTNDPILNEFRFTNVYRASDRVSQFLIRSVIYEGSQETEEVFFRTVLFKFFNSIETWENLAAAVGEITWREFDVVTYSEVLSGLRSKGSPIYSGAYIMPSAPKSFGHFQHKHDFHLALLVRMMEDGLPWRVKQSRSLKEVFELLRNYPGIGDFLAFQYAVDLNYSILIHFDENDFVVPGPGALRGIAKCFADLGGYDESDIIRIVTLNQRREFERCGLQFATLWGRELHMIDCQNLFCELDKYTRVSHPDAHVPRERHRIKRRYLPGRKSPDYWFPPKWGLETPKTSGIEVQ